MSGIAGIIHFDGAPAAPGLVAKMTSAMAYRGPDGIHHWIKGSVALGQCMLRTTPESLEEHQPLTNEDESLVLVMDGRVDNWEELRRDLLAREAVLRNRSDAELVLHAYETWGRDCLSHIDGDFALVIWDARRQEAFCARDRMGNKPLHYHWDGKTLAFASELHTILALPWVPEIPNEGMVAEYLAGEWSSRDETFWNGIVRLVAAHRMVVDGDGPHVDRYWAPDIWATLPYARDEDYIEHYRELFADVVRRLSRSHWPVACEVSGGLDSSAIFAVAVDLYRRGKFPAPDIQGYTLDFRGDPDADELAFSHAVGQHLGWPIYDVTPTKKPLSWYRDRARSHREFPGYPNGVMGLGIRAQTGARDGRALLVGAGGDEWVGGSRAYYAEALEAARWVELLRCFMADCDDVGIRRSLRWLLRGGLAAMLPPAVKSALKKVALGRKARGIDGVPWLNPKMRTAAKERRNRYSALSAEKGRRFGQREQTLVLSNAFSALARESEERLSAGEGIELRQPFWNSSIVQFAFMTPARLRWRGRFDKVMHRRAMVGLLPESVLNRETKADFMTTFRWHWSELKTEITQDIPQRRRDWVESGAVSVLYSQGQDSNHSGFPEWVLWTLFGCDALLTTA